MTKQTVKTWFITGASSGFGRAIAEEALRRGDKVIAAARNLGALEDLKSPAVKLQPLDVTDAKACEQAIQAAGPIDVLVNNAGFSIVGAGEETSEAQLRETMELMFFAPVRLSKLVLPGMRERKAGQIVQLTSVGGLITSPGFGAYCAAKHALEAWTEAVSAEVAPFGIKALIVEPGAFRTRLFGGAFRTMPEMPAYAATVGPTRNYAATNDGKQPGDPEKAARAIVEAVASNGTALRLPLGGDAVDGIRAKLRKVAQDIDAGEAAARATAFKS
jgi:NAD(P)-dependent dehydrogenase (short-subunit alcohol dehydrogenase family)